MPFSNSYSDEVKSRKMSLPTGAFVSLDYSIILIFYLDLDLE